MEVRRVLPALTVLVVLAVGACGAAGGSSAGGATESAEPVTLRLGHFPNITHATAIVGVESGIFQLALGQDKLVVQTFNAGPAAVEALFAGAIDAAYIGPNPAINAFTKSDGVAIRIISGATSGGASLVVKPNITGAASLKGKKLTSPQIGGTQDVALRHWLSDNGLETDPQGGGDVAILPQENAQTLEAFKSGAIDGAWVPEPWATRLVLEGGGKVLVDESTLWTGGTFVTTNLVVRTEFLKEHPATVRRLLRGQVEANAFVTAKPAEAQKLTNQGIEKLTGKRLSDAVIVAAWKNLTYTNDPIAPSLKTSAYHAYVVGLLDKADLSGIYDLVLLNEVLVEAGEPEVRAP